MAYLLHAHLVIVIYQFTIFHSLLHRGQLITVIIMSPTLVATTNLPCPLPDPSQLNNYIALPHPIFLTYLQIRAEILQL